MPDSNPPGPSRPDRPGVAMGRVTRCPPMHRNDIALAGPRLQGEGMTLKTRPGWRGALALALLAIAAIELVFGA